MIKNSFDEGFNLELVQTAFFEGVLEIPKIEPPEKIIIPSAMIPYSQRDAVKIFPNASSSTNTTLISPTSFANLKILSMTCCASPPS